MVLKYLKSTKHKSIHYKGNKINRLFRCSYTIGENTRRSKTNYIFLLEKVQ